ncbi:MAG: transglutaminase domain-containing protein [Planctomycetota bacterium]|nr:transglutaminase domain-containing protein [Planctomycetota bacterium]MDA1248149.1 transglutaminase domain-containing protein [Planctomycetota bacterium]
MTIHSRGFFCVVLLAPLLQSSTAAEIQPCPPGDNVLVVEELKQGERVRHFEFTYAGSAVKLKPGSKVRIWLPLPHSTEYQQIEVKSHSLPKQARVTSEEKYNNCMIFFETVAPKSGRVDFSVTYDVVRAEIKWPSRLGKTLLQSERDLFLAPNSRVPVSGRPLVLLEGLKLPSQPKELGRALYDRVDAHMKYDKSKPGYGTGDSVWACDSRFGNCTDFHSLFISLARSQGLPSQFEIGFPIPEKRGQGKIGGYHCWAFFHANELGWVPADISEANKNPEMKDYFFGNITENRVAFSVGRDLNLVPKQASPPLNFFVYPHIEVDGEELSKERMKKRFSFRDVN